MKTMGVAYNKKVKKNHKIAESEVSRASVARMDIQNVLGNQVKINAVQEAEPASARSSGFMPKKDNADIT